jgi:hypothetical protein
VYRLNDTGLLYKIKKAWADALGRSLDRAFVDVIGCGDSDLANYITKEMKKASSCEKAIKLLKQETGTAEQEKRDAARKKVLAFYFADKLKMRLLHVSKGIGAKAEPEEGEMPEAEFIEKVISEPPKGRRVLYSCKITRKELLKLIKYDEISPYTGAVEPISKEGAALMSIFEERFQISKVIGNKREIERVIAGREAAKLIKKKTAAIAKQAIYA